MYQVLSAFYAKIHAGIAHIHPFWDSNGRIARLLGNIPLLRAGLPPIVIPNEERRQYIQLLADYELAVGTIDRKTGVWPKPELLEDFTAFCGECYSVTRELVERVHENSATHESLFQAQAASKGSS